MLNSYRISRDILRLVPGKSSLIELYHNPSQNSSRSEGNYCFDLSYVVLYHRELNSSLLISFPPKLNYNSSCLDSYLRQDTPLFQVLNLQLPSVPCAVYTYLLPYTYRCHILRSHFCISGLSVSTCNSSNI